MIASVIVDIKHKEINQVFDYFVPDTEVETIKRGMRVIVPFTDHNIERLGLIVELKNESDAATKTIKEVIDLTPILSEEFFILLDEMLKVPNTLIASAIEAMIPNDMLMYYIKKITLLNEENVDTEIKTMFNTKHEFILKKKDQNLYPKLRRLEENGYVKIETILTPKVKKEYITYLILKNGSLVKTDRHKEIVRHFDGRFKILKKELVEIYGSSSIKTLIKNGCLEELDILKHLEDETTERLELKPLKDELQKPFNEIEFNQFNTYLIEGMNEDSRTFIQHAVRKIIDQGQQVLVLVPEKFMVDHYIDLFKEGFKDVLVVGISSDQTYKERYLNQESLLDNDARIAIGTRLSVFTQFKNLGGIFILFSHDEAYYPFEGLYYDPFKLLTLRAEINEIPLFLNTHTKTLNDFYQIDLGNYTYIDLKKDNFDTKITLVDMKEELKMGNTKMLSHVLKEKIDETLTLNKNSLLVLNQKGLSRFVMCRSCSHVPKDPATDIPLNYIEKTGMLRSNLTKYQEPFTKTCPICGKDSMKPVGAGIELLKTYLNKVYPNETIIQIDKDTLSSKETYEIIKNTTLKDRKIFIGTQMALKSLFKDKISLVGVLLADSFLKLPRFDANEVGFKILNDAKHIAKDDLVIQAYDSNHFVLSALSSEDIFYKAELSNRKVSKLPPFNELLQIRISAESYLRVHQYAHILKNKLALENIQVLGPIDATPLKLENHYRVLLLMKYQKIEESVKSLLVSTKEFNIDINKNVTWY